MVKRIDFHRFVDEGRVTAAIVNAEKLTNAPIAVSVSPYFWGSARRTAESAFQRQRHRRSATAQRNAVFFFVVPSRRQFVVLGDAAAHEKLGQPVWNRIVSDIQGHFRSSDPTAALVYGIAEIGRHLAVHFPRQPSPNSEHELNSQPR